MNYLNNIKTNNKLALLVLTTYVILYSFFLIHTNFLPYGMDNNETWSNLAHAKNAYDYGFSKSKGLADEAQDFTGNHPERHPLVHTHQGDFPRLIPTVLYFCGFHSPESHILLLTFTVGLSGVLAAYFLIARIAGAPVAALFCLFMMTDYLMFAQWQVNTWRVWQGFFFFGSLLATDRISRGNEMWFDWVALFLLIAATFYSELVFASFVFSTIIAYAILQDCAHKTGKTLKIFINSTLGAVAAVTTLIIQLIKYYGIDSLLEDAKYTITARNFLTDPGYQKSAIDFLKSKNVLFLQNFTDGDYHNIKWLLSTFFNFIIGTWSPKLVQLTILTLFPVASFYIFTKLIQSPIFSKITAYIFPTNEKNKLDILSKNIIKNVGKLGALICYCISITISAALLIILLLKKELSYSTLANESIVLIIPVVCFGVFIAIISLIPLVLEGKKYNAFNIFVLSILIFISSVSTFRYSSNFTILESFYRCIYNIYLPNGIFVLICAAIIFLMPVFLLSDFKFRLPNGFSPIRVIFLLVSCFIGFIVAWAWSPGYLKSGYLDRFCPIATYPLYILPALSLYLYISFSLAIIYKKYNTSKYGRKIFTSISIVISVLFVCMWIRVQIVSLEIIPPHLGKLFKRLQSPDLIGKNILTNNYATPSAFSTKGMGSLAYEYTGVRPGNSKSPLFTYDVSGLWVADPDKNFYYLQPDIFVYFDQPGTFHYITQRSKMIMAKSKSISSYLKSSILQDVLTHDKYSRTPDIIAFDTDRWGAWAIIKKN